MESWCFDSINGSNNMLMEWDFKVPFTYENSVENPSFPEVTKNEATVKDIVSPSSMVISSLVSEEESVVDSNSRESSLVDVKLGGVSDNIANNSSKGAPSSSESSNRVKRVRRTGFSSQAVCCQVHGCNKDLSSAKEYHRRHKVCDAHSKTSKVVVSGIEQRFCQQCSRFHLLGEFDDGKRSCRKRLAGHNQRRRKPQVGCNGRAGRSFSYTGSVGSKFPGTTLTSTCFIYQDIIPQGASHADKYGTNVWAPHVKIEDETNGWSPQVKIEDGADYSQKSNYIAGQFQERSDVPAFPVGKLHCSTDNVSDNRSQSEIVSHSFVQMSSLVSKDLTPFDEASTVQGLAGISESGCALSLLSSQSQNYKSTDLSSGMLGAHTYVIPNRSTHYNVAEVSEKLLRVGSRSLTSGDEEEYYSLERSNQSAMPVLSNGNVILQDSEFMNDKNPQLCEEESTIDLFRLSSQLHRVENQRQSATSEQELESFWS